MKYLIILNSILIFLLVVFWYTTYEQDKQIDQLNKEVLELQVAMPDKEILDNLNWDYQETVSWLIDLVNVLDAQFKKIQAQVEFLATEIDKLNKYVDEAFKIYDDNVLKYNEAFEEIYNYLSR